MTGSDDPDVKAHIDGDLAKPDLDLRQQVSAVLRQHRIDFALTDPAQAADHCACGLLITDWDEHWADIVTAVAQPELDQRDTDLADLRATIDRLKKLAIMGGQNPITIRQWIIAELFPQYPPAKPVPDLTDLPAAPREPRR
jgi:hypothetical protein